MYFKSPRWYYGYSMDLPSLPNNSTPNAANMKNNRKNRSPKFPTCGNACITVSKRALIPLAIFSNFKTGKNKTKIVNSNNDSNINNDNNNIVFSRVFMETFSNLYNEI